MKNILTITTNPAVDTSTIVGKLIPEQKLECDLPKHEPGGGGINVSRALKRLGSSSVALFPSGGMTGDLLTTLLSKEKVNYETIKTINETRENFIVVESISNQQYRFGMPGTEIYPLEEKLLMLAVEKLSLKANYIVASGSIPPGMQADFYAKVARISTKNECRFIADTSGESLQEVINEGVYLLKPNLRELSQLSGITTLDNGSIVDASRTLIRKNRCEIVVVSMGPQGAYLITKNLAEHVRAPTVKKLSTVGAGDSMVAGMVHSLSKGKSLQEMVRMGIACGTAATMNPGTELFKMVDAEKLYKWLTRNFKK